MYVLILLDKFLKHTSFLIPKSSIIIQEPFPPTNTNIQVPSYIGSSPGDVTENLKKNSNDEIKSTIDQQQSGSSTGERSETTLQAK